MSSFRLLVVTAILMFAAACSGNSDSPSTPSPSTPPPAASAITIPVGAETLANRAFVPDVFNAGIGDTLTWTNSDTVGHTSTSDLPGWDSGIVAPGRQFA